MVKEQKRVLKRENVPPGSLFSLNNDYLSLPDLLQLSQSQPYNYPIKASVERECDEIELYQLFPLERSAQMVPLCLYEQ